MKIQVLFGQRIERYAGQYAPEAIAITDEWSSEDNPEWIEDTLKENEATGEFESLAIITFEVPQEEVMKRLRPDYDVLPATVV